MTELSAETERAVIDTLVRYATAIDTKDWNLLAECFWPSASFTATGVDLCGVDQIVAFMAQAHDLIDGSQHRLSNFSLRPAPDGRVDATTYLDALIVHRAHPDGPTLRVISSYHDLLESRRGSWRIASRRVSSLWSDGNPTILGPVLR